MNQSSVPPRLAFTLLVVAVAAVSAGCSSSGGTTGPATSGTGPAATHQVATPAASSQPSKPAQVALSATAWADQVCATATQVSGAFNGPAPQFSAANPSSAQLATVQEWLVQRAQARRAVVAAFTQPLTADLSQAQAFIPQTTVMLSWAASYDDAVRTKLASMDPQHAVGLWLQISDRHLGTFNKAVAASVFSTPQPSGPPPPTDAAGSQLETLTAGISAHPGCRDALAGASIDVDFPM